MNKSIIFMFFMSIILMSIFMFNYNTENYLKYVLLIMSYGLMGLAVNKEHKMRKKRN